MGGAPVEAKKSKQSTILSMRDSGGGFFIEEREQLAENGEGMSVLILRFFFPDFHPNFFIEKTFSSKELTMLKKKLDIFYALFYWQ